MEKNIENKNKIIKLIPLILVLALVPLIVHMKTLELKGASFTYWVGESVRDDFFSYYKMLFLLIFTGTMVLIFIYDLIKKNIEIKKSVIYIPMGIYAAFIIISTILAEHKSIALFGFVDRYEGMLVLLAYLVLMFICINYVNSEKHIRFLIGALIISAVIIGTIGLFQYLGYNFYNTGIAKRLFLPSKYWNVENPFAFKIGENVIYSTLYHYNYVGSYMAMLFPLTLTMTLLSKDIKVKITLGLVTVIMFINWIGSNSRAGVVGGSLAILVLFIFMRNKIKEHWKLSLILLISLVVIFFGLNAVSKGSLVNRLSSIVKNITGTANDGGSSLYDDIIVEGNTIKIIDGEKILSIAHDNKSVEFKDKDNNTLLLNSDESGNVKFKDDKYNDYTIRMEQVTLANGKSFLIAINKKNINVQFLVVKNGYKIIAKGKAHDIKNADSWGFEGKEKMGSSRGYIWSRSIPLLKGTILVGNGPDTFATYFPQDDYLGLLKAYDTTDVLVDKVHNLYLQNAINTGVISLIAFITIFIIYIISCFRAYFKNSFNDIYSISGLAIFVATIGYLGAGFFNDSVVSVAPVFWMLMGIGMSLNMKVIKEK